MKKWDFSDAEKTGEYVGIVEFQSDDGEWHYFYVYETKERIVFGGATNVGFLESGYMEKDSAFSLDEHIQTLVEELETFYNAGAQHATELVCTERM